MTLEEAIKNFEQEIGEFEGFKIIHAVTYEDYEYIEKIRQLAEWLKELKERRTNTGDMISRKSAIDALCSVCGADCDKSEFVYYGKQEDQVILCPEHYVLTQLPSVQPEIIRCKECKHRPIATRAEEGIFYGFSVAFPDDTCPCQCDDGYYSWYPKDNFYCGKAERKIDD